MKKKEIFNIFGPDLEDILLHLARKEDHALRSPNNEAIQQINNAAGVSLENEPGLIDMDCDGDLRVEIFLRKDPDFVEIIESIEDFKMQVEKNEIQAGKKEEDLFDLLVPTPEEINNTIAEFEKSLTPIPLQIEESYLEEERDSVEEGTSLEYEETHITPGGQVIQVFPNDIVSGQVGNWYRPIELTLNMVWLPQMAACVLMIFMFSLGLMNSLKVAPNGSNAVNGAPQRDLSGISVFPEDGLLGGENSGIQGERSIPEFKVAQRLRELKLQNSELSSLPNLGDLSKLKQLGIEYEAPLKSNLPEIKLEDMDDMGLSDFDIKNPDLTKVEIFFNEEVKEKPEPYSWEGDLLYDYTAMEIIELKPQSFKPELMAYLNEINVSNEDSILIMSVKPKELMIDNNLVIEFSREFPRLSDERFKLILEEVEYNLAKEQSRGIIWENNRDFWLADTFRYLVSILNSHSGSIDSINVSCLDFDVDSTAYYPILIEDALIGGHGTHIAGLEVLSNDCVSKGVEHFEKGNFEEAIINYEMAIAINPNNVLAHCKSGVVYKELGEYDKAINAFERAIQLDASIKEALKEENFEFEIRVPALILNN